MKEIGKTPYFTATVDGDVIRLVDINDNTTVIDVQEVKEMIQLLNKCEQEMRGGEDMTVREFAGRLWYSQEIMVVPHKHDAITYPTIDNFKKIAIWTGANYTLGSVRADAINNKQVKGYGVVGNVLIIEVE